MPPSDKPAVILKYLGDKGFFLPPMLPTNRKQFKAVDGHDIQSLGQVQISSEAEHRRRPLQSQEHQSSHHPCDETTAVDGASCPGEIILGNPFLVHSGLNVTDFIAEYIERLSSLDYGNLHGDPAPAKAEKLGVKLLIGGAEPAQAAPHALGFSAAALHLSRMIANGDLPLVDGDDIDYKDVEIGDQDE